jgi:hypothetical protein
VKVGIERHLSSGRFVSNGVRFEWETRDGRMLLRAKTQGRPRARWPVWSMSLDSAALHGRSPGDAARYLALTRPWAPDASA